MTSLSFYESLFGVKKDFLTKKEAAEFAERYANHRWEEFKKTKEIFNSEQWLNHANFEEKRKRLGDNK